MSIWGQKKMDDLWYGLGLRFLPKNFSPNIFTFIRLALIPVILYFIAVANFSFALISFILAALCDALDGSLARKTGQLSDWGAFLDPIADKFLIILLAMFLMYYYPWPLLLFFVLFFDFLTGALGLGFLVVFRDRTIPSANIVGKAKMVVEVAAIVAVLIWLLVGGQLLLVVSAVFLATAALLGYFSILGYIWEVYK